MASRVGASKQIILSPQSDGTKRTFHSVVVDFDTTVTAVQG
jgi:hypothetical protein